MQGKPKTTKQETRGILVNKQHENEIDRMKIVQTFNKYFLYKINFSVHY